jgi:flagellar hook assembly protein FlgD
VSDKEFISQQAQFAQLEKLDDINASIGQGNNIVQASNLVGKKVDVTTKEGTKVSGVIDSIEMSDKGLGVRIGNQLYPPSKIIKIYANANA